MKLSIKSITRKAAVLSFAGVIAMSAAIPAFAADSNISQGVTAGTLTAALSAAPTFTGVTSTHAAQNSDSSSPTLTADDATGNALGWDVSLLASDLTGDAGGTIAANQISVLALGTIGSTNGVLTGMSQTGGMGELSAARNVMSASAGHGQGTYTQTVQLRVIVPANVHSGAFAGTITTTNTTR